MSDPEFDPVLVLTAVFLVVALFAANEWRIFVKLILLQIMRPALFFIRYLAVGFVYITSANDKHNVEIDWCYQYSSCKFICCKF